MAKNSASAMLIHCMLPRDRDELNDMLERTAKQVISPQLHEIRSEQHRKDKTLYTQTRYPYRLVACLLISMTRSTNRSAVQCRKHATED